MSHWGARCERCGEDITYLSDIPPEGYTCPSCGLPLKFNYFTDEQITFVFFALMVLAVIMLSCLAVIAVG